jgi:hypothetical protein
MKRFIRIVFQIACIPLAFLIMDMIAAWIDWLRVMSPERAEQYYHTRVPMGYTAVIMDHGHYIQMDYGTIYDNPAGFGAYTMLIVLFGYLFLRACKFLDRRFPATQKRGNSENTGQHQK